MAYADDMVLLADSNSDLEEMLRSFDSTCSSMGLTVSTAKTKVLAFLPSGQIEPAIPLTLHPGESDVLVVDTFAYLGCLVEKNCSIDAEVNFHIEKASRAFSSLSRVLWYKKRIRTSTKLCLLKVVILPVLKYGLESAVLLSHHVDASKHSTKGVSASSWGFHYGRRGGICLSGHRHSRNALTPP